MMTASRRRWIATASALLVTFATAGGARAADDDDAAPDARLAGYDPAKKVEIGGGVAGSFAILALVGVISVGVMFKNANRSHLD